MQSYRVEGCGRLLDIASSTWKFKHLTTYASLPITTTLALGALRIKLPLRLASLHVRVY
jgi:hypothetical protein